MMAVSKPFSGLFSIADFGLSAVLSIHREIGRKLFDHKAKENKILASYKEEIQMKTSDFTFNSPCNKKNAKTKIKIKVHIEGILIQ